MSTKQHPLKIRLFHPKLIEKHKNLLMSHMAFVSLSKRFLQKWIKNFVGLLRAQRTFAIILRKVSSFSTFNWFLMTNDFHRAFSPNLTLPNCKGKLQFSPMKCIDIEPKILSGRLITTECRRRSPRYTQFASPSSVRCVVRKRERENYRKNDNFPREFPLTFRVFMRQQNLFNDSSCLH